MERAGAGIVPGRAPRLKSGRSKRSGPANICDENLSRREPLPSAERYRPECNKGPSRGVSWLNPVPPAPISIRLSAKQKNTRLILPARRRTPHRMFMNARAIAPPISPTAPMRRRARLPAHWSAHSVTRSKLSPIRRWPSPLGSVGSLAARIVRSDPSCRRKSQRKSGKPRIKWRGASSVRAASRAHPIPPR